MSAANAAAVKRLESLFQDVRLTDSKKSRKKSSVASIEPLYETTVVETSVDRNCDVHGGKEARAGRRGSIGNVAVAAARRPSTVGFSLGSRRDSMPALHWGRRDSTVHLGGVRRDSFGLGLPPARSQEPLVHPSSFPSMLRRDSLAASTGSLRRDSIVSIGSGGRRFSTDSLDVRRNSWDFGRRGSSSSSGGWEPPILEEINGKVSWRPIVLP